MSLPSSATAAAAVPNQCPEKAISEVDRSIGVIESGSANGLAFTHGRLDPGEAMSPPLIRAVKNRIDPDKITVIDAPPGTSCPVVTAVNGCDFCLLVTEPTPFGLNDLDFAYQMVDKLGLPAGVVEGKEYLIIDRPPGIGCPVIASFAGVQAALVVTEPTLSGIHDLKRGLEVCRHFRVPAAVCINRFDLDEQNTQAIEAYCKKEAVVLAGKIPFDRIFVETLVQGVPVVEYTDGPVSQSIKEIWERVVIHPALPVLLQVFLFQSIDDVFLFQPGTGMEHGRKDD